MKAVIYTDNPTYAKYLAEVKVLNTDIEVKVVKLPKFSTFTTISLNWENKSITETVLNWKEVKKFNKGEEFTGIVVRQKDYGIRRGLYGLYNKDLNLFQVFAKNGRKLLQSTVKHEILHGLANRLKKPDTLHADLRAKKTLEDFELKLFSLSNSESLHTLAKSSVGKDVSPLDQAPDELGCAESVSNLIKMIERDFPIHVSTARLFEECSRRYKRTLEIKPGYILISPTGYGNGKVIGHTGIIGESVIYSNNSNTGLWDDKWTIDTWVKYYRGKGGLPLYVFNPNDKIN